MQALQEQPEREYEMVRKASSNPQRWNDPPDSAWLNQKELQRSLEKRDGNALLLPVNNDTQQHPSQQQQRQRQRSSSAHTVLDSVRPDWDCRVSVRVHRSDHDSVRPNLDCRASVRVIPQHNRLFRSPKDCLRNIKTRPVSW